MNAYPDCNLQNTEQKTQGLRSRLEAAEQRLQQMMTLVTKSVQNSVLLQHLLNQQQARHISGPVKSKSAALCIVACDVLLACDVAAKPKHICMCAAMLHVCCPDSAALPQFFLVHIFRNMLA